MLQSSVRLRPRELLDFPAEQFSVERFRSFDIVRRDFKPHDGDEPTEPVPDHPAHHEKQRDDDGKVVEKPQVRKLNIGPRFR